MALRWPPPWRLSSALGVAGCATGIAASTPASNGQSFVAGSPGTTEFKSGTGPVAPPVSGPVVGGGRLALASYRGHVVVLNFWGSWCTPCRAEAPGLSALATHVQVLRRPVPGHRHPGQPGHCRGVHERLPDHLSRA